MVKLRVLLDRSAALEPRLMLAGDAGATVAQVAAAEIVSTGMNISPNSVSSPRRLVLVDESLPDLTTLLRDTPSDATIILLDPDQDFEPQLTRSIRKHHNFASIHLVTHGQGYCWLARMSLVRLM